jgi:hypothetical protein
LLFSIYVIGTLFETYNPTPTHMEYNTVCKYIVTIPLVTNLIFMMLMIVVLLVYAVRHVYRLMTETLLSANANLTPE